LTAKLTAISDPQLTAICLRQFRSGARRAFSKARSMASAAGYAQGRSDGGVDTLDGAGSRSLLTLDVDEGLYVGR
jgi:hypothetical protein